MRIDVKHIFCPTEMSPESRESLHYAIDLAMAYEAKLFVCHCVEGPASADKSGMERIKGLFEDMVGDHVRLGDSPALDWEGVVVAGNPADVIVREAVGREVDLIVMRTRHRPYAAARFGEKLESCAFCGAVVWPVDDLVEQVAQRVVVSGGEVEHVSGAAAERLGGAGSVGAFLKF
jgi:nucleotide-binding universal stress UspA family protein